MHRAASVGYVIFLVVTIWGLFPTLVLGSAYYLDHYYISPCKLAGGHWSLAGCLRTEAYHPYKAPK